MMTTTMMMKTKTINADQSYIPLSILMNRNTGVKAKETEEKDGLEDIMKRVPVSGFNFFSQINQSDSDDRQGLTHNTK